MPAKFTSSFAALLNKKAGISVKEAEDGEAIEPGVCLVIPGGSHGVVEIRKDGDLEEKIIHLNKELPVNGYRPSIDVLMKSVAEKYKDNAIGIILTGMGCDGKEGMRAIHDNGGFTIVQSLETSVITSMPNSVLAINCADEILSPGEIIEKLKSI
jgi:two-component system chemotaxis response regulator CheB